MNDTEFQAMRQAVIDGDADAAEAAARAAIAAGIPPLKAIDEGFMPGMKEVGAGFAAGDLYLPDMLLAARAMQRALGVMEPELKAMARRHYLVLSPGAVQPLLTAIDYRHLVRPMFPQEDGFDWSPQARVFGG